MAICTLAACESSSGIPSSGPPESRGNDGGGTGGAAGAQAIVPACPARHTPAAPEPNGDPVRDMVVAQRFAALDNFVGRYLRGEARTYTGSASISETLGFAGVPAANPIATESAVAGLIVDAVTATLTVGDAAAHQRVIFSQATAAPTVTDVSHIFPDLTYPAGPSGPTCAECLPNLFAPPAALTWNIDAHFLGEYRSDGSVAEFPFDVTASVDMRVRTPCALTWDELVVLNGGAFEYQQVGGEMVRHERSWLQTKIATPHMCDGEQVPYQIDVYVNLSDLFDYGVRNFTKGAPQTMCGA